MKELWAELLSDWVGQLSLFVIAFIIVMAIFFIIYFLKKSGEGPKT
jgi:regulatory protein YycI of two-component signal transduction system YycFG